MWHHDFLLWNAAVEVIEARVNHELEWMFCDPCSVLSQIRNQLLYGLLHSEKTREWQAKKLDSLNRSDPLRILRYGGIQSWNPQCSASRRVYHWTSQLFSEMHSSRWPSWSPLQVGNCAETLQIHFNFQRNACEVLLKNILQDIIVFFCDEAYFQLSGSIKK